VWKQRRRRTSKENMMRLTTSSLVLAAALAALGVACGGSKKQAKTAEAPIASETDKKATPTADGVSISPELKKICKIEDTSIPRFGYDSATLDPGTVTTLQKLAECLTTGPLKGKRVKLVGRADPRGPEQYNMVLGAARADQVRRYLSDRGVGDAAMTITSRGELDATGVDESGWSFDRRVDVELAQL